MLTADDAALAAIAGNSAARRLATMRACLQRVLQTRIEGRPLLGDTEQLIDYLTFATAFAQVEQVRTLFLNAKLELIRDEVASTGCIAEAPIYIRPILKRALDLGATALILAHNHPSGDPTPSDTDQASTDQLKVGLDAIGVELVDHLVLAQGRWFSFRNADRL